MARAPIKATTQTKALSMGEYAYGQSRLGLGNEEQPGSTSIKFSSKASDAIFRRSAMKAMATVVAATIMASALAPSVAQAQGVQDDAAVKAQIVKVIDQQVRKESPAPYAATKLSQQDQQKLRKAINGPLTQEQFNAIADVALATSAQEVIDAGVMESIGAGDYFGASLALEKLTKSHPQLERVVNVARVSLESPFSAQAREHSQQNLKQAQEDFEQTWAKVQSMTGELDRTASDVSASDIEAMTALSEKMTELQSAVEKAEAASYRLDNAFIKSQDLAQKHINELITKGAGIDKKQLSNAMSTHNVLENQSQGINENIDRMVNLRMKYQNVNHRLANAIGAQQSGDAAQVVQAVQALKVTMNDTMTGVLSKDTDIAHALSDKVLNEWEQAALSKLPADHPLTQQSPTPDNHLRVSKSAPAA